MNDYEKGFRDAVAALTDKLDVVDTLTFKARARRVGKLLLQKLAEEHPGSTLAELELMMGHDWIEREKAYPKALGLALLNSNLNPDDEATRAMAMDAFRESFQAAA